jgi:hypothetical protein
MIQIHDDPNSLGQIPEDLPVDSPLKIELIGVTPNFYSRVPDILFVTINHTDSALCGKHAQ